MPFNPYCYSIPNVLLNQRYERLWDKIDQCIQRITQHRSKLPPWISSFTSDLMKRANIIRITANIKLSKLIKLKRFEKQIKKSAENDLPEFEKTILEGRKFSKI